MAAAVLVEMPLTQWLGKRRLTELLTQAVAVGRLVTADQAL
jgi:hypothetical protein